MAVRWKFLETNRWKVCIEYNSTFKYQSGWPCLSQGALTGGAPPRVYWLVPSLPTMHSHSHRFPFSPLSSHPVLSTFFNLLPSTLPNFPAACHSFSPFPLRASFIFFFRPRTSFFGVAPLADIGIRLEPPLLRFLHSPSLSVFLFLVLASFPNVVPLLSTDVERPIFSLICYEFQVFQYIQNFSFRQSDTLSVSSFSFHEHLQVWSCLCSLFALHLFFPSYTRLIVCSPCNLF